MYDFETIPGPSLTDLIRQLPQLLRNPPEAFLAWRRRYGDVVRVPFERPLALLLYNPNDIRHVLVKNTQNYRKCGALLFGKKLLGQGLLSIQEPQHQRHRRLIQPAFHPRKVHELAQLILEAAYAGLSNWQDSSVINVSREMSRLTLTIVGQSLFSKDYSGQSYELYGLVSRAQRYLSRVIRCIPEGVPTPLNVSYKRAVRKIDTIVHQLIDERRQLDIPGDDLLSLLVDARFDDGTGFSDKQIRDEVVTFILAGHETTANALTWAWFLLSENPAAESRLATEVKNVVGERSVTVEDIPKLHYATMVFTETLRLYPPVWILDRVALEDDTLESGIQIPAGTHVTLSPYVAHRDERFFPDPTRFYPERFEDDPRGTTSPRGVYFPFGGGTRSCIGEIFARTEAVCLLAVIAQRYRMEAVSHTKPAPLPRVTLRPKHDLMMRVHSRDTVVQ